MLGTRELSDRFVSFTQGPLNMHTVGHKSLPQIFATKRRPENFGTQVQRPMRISVLLTHGASNLTNHRVGRNGYYTPKLWIQGYNPRIHGNSACFAYLEPRKLSWPTVHMCTFECTFMCNTCLWVQQESEECVLYHEPHIWSARSSDAPPFHDNTENEVSFLTLAIGWGENLKL